MAAGAAAGQHAEDAAERHGVERRADEVIIQHDEQAVDADVHQERCIAVLLREVDAVAGVAEQTPVVLRAAAQHERADNAQAEHAEAEHIGHIPARDAEIGARAAGQRAAERLIEQSADEEGRQADGHRGGIEVIALVHLRRVDQPGGQAEADEQADRNGQQDALPAEADDIRMGIADHQVREQRADAGREDHGVDLVRGIFALDQAVQQHAKEAEPEVQDVDAPEAEPGRQQKGEARRGVDLDLREAVEGREDEADEARVQERSGVAAVIKIVGRDLEDSVMMRRRPVNISARSGAMKAEHKKAKVNAANRSLRKLLAESCFSLCMILSQLSRPKIRRARQLR